MRGRYLVAGGLLTALLAVVAVAVVFASASASLSPDSRALAKVGMPLGGGRIDRVTVVSGPHSGRIPAEVRGTQIWPRGLIQAHDAVTVDVVVKRPGWISWLSGGAQHLCLNLRTPSAKLRAHYLTLASGAPLRLQFQQPIGVIAYGPPGHLERHVLSSPRTEFTLARASEAGVISVAAAPRAWEISAPAEVSWFPAGTQASVVAAPAPGTAIKPDTPISLTFSKTVQDALGGAKPSVTPATPGSWQTVNSHTIVFKPSGYGYGIGVSVGVALPSGVRLLGAQQTAASTRGAWTVPPGTTVRLQQLLASLGYLPLNFSESGSAPALTAPAQEAAAISPPGGSFSWRYGATPSALRSFWQPGAAGVMTRGAVMAFENDHGLTADGVVGASVWRALIGARLSGHGSSSGYSFVSVSVGSQSLNLWHNGHTVINTAVNTGISSAPTATGTYPVYEHISSGTMSGSNPDGSHYNDPGIPWISYFNGGDALHGFTRASYGSPQSLGCVEMSFGPAGQVWPYTPIGTLVDVN